MVVTVVAKTSSMAMRAKRRIAPTLIIFFTIVNSISGGGMVVKGITIYSEFGGLHGILRVEIVFEVAKSCFHVQQLHANYSTCGMH